MKNEVTLLIYIAQLEEKIVRLEANKAILLQIIEACDSLHKVKSRKNELSFLSEILLQKEKDYELNNNKMD